MFLFLYGQVHELPSIVILNNFECIYNVFNLDVFLGVY